MSRQVQLSERIRRRGIMVATALVAGGLAWPGMASAAPYENVHESWSETTELPDFCDVPGLAVRVVESVTEHRLISQRRGPDGLYYFHVNFHEVQTFTNLATGKSFTIDRRVTDRDAKVRFNADGTVVLTEAVSGPAKVIGPDGRRLFLDAGSVAWEVLLDADLQFVEFLGVVRDTGRSDTAERDFCVDFLTYTA